MAPFDTLKNLWSIRDDFNDVTISCKNNQTLKAHKVVLSAASKHLHDHCTNNGVINLAEISLEVVEHLLEFIYTGNPPTDDNHLKQDVHDLATCWCIEAARNLGDPPELVEDKVLEVEKASNLDFQEPAAPPCEDLKNMAPDQYAELPEIGLAEEEPTDTEQCPDVVEVKLPEPPKAAEGGPTSKTSIPDELIVKIFSNIPTYTLLNVVPKVSRQFSRLSQDTGAHVLVDLTGCYMDFGKVRSFLSGKRRIEDIRIKMGRVTSNSDEVKSVLDLAIMDQRMTRSVFLSMKDQGPVFFEQLANNPSKAEQLRRLEVKCTRVKPPTEVPRLKNLTWLSLHFTETKSEAVDQFEFITELASGSEKLESLELRHDDNLDEDRLASFIEIHGRTLKRLDCPKWKMSPYFASNHLTPGSSFQNLEILTFDGSENSLNTLLQIAQLPKLKELTINWRYDLSEDMIIQLFSAIDLTKVVSFTINADWRPESFTFSFTKRASVSLKLGKTFSFKKGENNFSDLSQILKLPCLDHLESYGTSGGRCDDFGTLKRFENLERVRINLESLSFDDILALVLLANERPALETLWAETGRADGPKLYLRSRKYLTLDTGPGTNFGAEVAAILDSLVLFQLEKIEIKTACPVSENVIELVSKMTKLTELQIELDKFSVTNVVAMLKFAVAQKVTKLKLIAKEKFWQLTDLNQFSMDLGQDSLQPNDLKLILSCLESLKLPKIELSFGGDYQVELTEAIGEVKSLKYLALRNTNLQRVPNFLNPELETLKISGKWSPGRSGVDEGAMKEYYTATGVIDSPKGRINFLTKDDLARISALPKLKYFQMCPTVSCCQISSQRFSPNY